jgi:hypothetical protein
MKIKMIVYSYTHNTLLLIQEWAKQLNQHDTEIASIHAYDEYPNTKTITLSEKPSIASTDHLVFATCVRGGTLAPIMAAYLKQMPDLRGQACTLVLTQYFPFEAWGGRQAMKQFRALVEAKSGRIKDTFIYSRMRKSADQKARILNHVPQA